MLEMSPSVSCSKNRMIRILFLSPSGGTSVPLLARYGEPVKRPSRKDSTAVYEPWPMTYSSCCRRSGKESLKVFRWASKATKPVTFVALFDEYTTFDARSRATVVVWLELNELAIAW